MGSTKASFAMSVFIPFISQERCEDGAAVRGRDAFDRQGVDASELVQAPNPGSSIVVACRASMACCGTPAQSCVVGITLPAARDILRRALGRAAAGC